MEHDHSPLKRNYTPRESAQIRCRTEQALTMERQRGEGPPYILDGGRILYPIEEHDAYLARRRVDPALLPKPRKRTKAS